MQSPNSYFMDVKCPGASILASIQTFLMFMDTRESCFAITAILSHAQTIVLCAACGSVLCQPASGKARLTEGMCSPFPPVFAVAD